MAASYLAHYGTPRHSGRYPFGSGDNPYQHEPSFLGTVKKYRDEGLSEIEIAKAMGFNSTTELRNRIAAENNERRKADIARALELKQKGYSNVKIGEMMGINESSVRSLLNPKSIANSKLIDQTIDILKEQVAEKQYIDVGIGTELSLGVSRDKLKKALALMEEEGYVVQQQYVEQLGTGKKTELLILAPPGTSGKEIWDNHDKIRTIEEYRYDPDSESYKGPKDIKPPVSINSDRIDICYAEDGGNTKDGVIQIRRGAEDLSLGDAKYAQVRIAVDGTHYLKGMAMYSDGPFPDGVDVIFNTNKHKDVSKMDVLKKMKDDPENPFGATIKRQLEYNDISGAKKQSAINIVNEEGDWSEWSKTLSSQMLSKQPEKLIKQQLNLAYDQKAEEFSEISALTNPVIKKELLMSFADDCDASASHLKAASLPRQASHVILPIDSLGDNEVYAPNYRNGETVVLIRYPHGGKFEIPELRVNNNNKEANSVMKQATDAIGINSKVAARLSGADFDGDTVLVIPNNTGAIKTSPALKGLENFDPKESYPGYPGMKKLSNERKQLEMGKVSNLITDMTLKGADAEEICRAVKHSMVVIDAEKHNLDWKKSEQDQRIGELKKKYQGGENKGASTLISMAGAEVYVPERRNYLKKSDIDPETGKRTYEDTGRTYTKYKKVTNPETGKSEYIVEKENVKAQTKVPRMSLYDNAFDISSGTRAENAYAAYANALKGLANAARKEWLSTGNQIYNPSAAKTFATEVKELKANLNIALKNAPRERQAQLIANELYKIRKAANPDLSEDDVKKIKNQCLNAGRIRAGASRKDASIYISDKQWEAIQSGAVSHSLLTRIINNSDKDRVRELATPRNYRSVTQTQINLMRSMAASGYTQSEIAEATGISTSTINKVLNGKQPA